MQVVIDLCLEGMPCVSALRRFSLEARRQRQIVVVLLMIDFMLIISPFQKLHWDFQERPRENVTKEPQIIIEKEPHIFWFASSCIVGSLYEGSLSLWTEYLVELGTIENVRSGSTRPRVLVGLRICGRDHRLSESGVLLVLVDLSPDTGHHLSHQMPNLSSHSST